MLSAQVKRLLRCEQGEFVGEKRIYMQTTLLRSLRGFNSVEGGGGAVDVEKFPWRKERVVRDEFVEEQRNCIEKRPNN